MTVSGEGYRICSRCVMDTSDPEIRFDDAGVCNLCTDYLQNRLNVVAPERGEVPLAALLDRVKQAGRGRKYDCVVGVSGGVDSSTVLRLAVAHGLRVLAVHMDNGWNSPVAVQNINRLVQQLGVDYASYVLPWDDFRKTQVAFLRASVPEVETPTDIAIQRAVHHHASRHGVRYVLGGGNIASEGILPVSWHYNGRDMTYNNAILDAGQCPRRNFAAARFGVLDEFYMKIIRSIRTVYPLNYYEFDKDAERTLLERDFGWQYYGSKHGESRFTKFIQNYYLYAKHGIDYRRATASSELCFGKIDRATALQRLESSPHADMDVPMEMDYVAKKLAIPREELDRIVAAPAKWYFDYPNNKKLLGMVYDAYRLLHGKRKTSNF